MNDVSVPDLHRFTGAWESGEVSKKLKNIGIVSLLTVVSRILGLVRDQLSAAIFGASVINSAFITAFNLPNLFRRLLGEGALTAAFVPTLQEEIRDSGQDGAFRLLSKVVSWLALVTGVLVGLAMLVFSQSRQLEGHEPKWYLAADLTVILFPYLIFVCLAAAFSAALNVMHRFLEPALSPIWLNLTMIASLGGAGWNFAHTDQGRVHWLCAGVLAGGFLQMAVPAVVLMRQGWKPKLDFALTPRVREIGVLMAPGLFGTAIYQINVFVSRTLAYSIDDSSATVLFLANRLMELPIGVFAIAVATVVYPLIAKHAAEKDFALMAEDYRKGLRIILMINIPAAAGLALLSDPIVRLLFQHGRFTAENAHAMSVLLQLFVAAMPFFSVVSLTTRAFYAVKDTRTPVKAAAWSFVVNLAFSLLLKDVWGAPGLVFASTVAVIFQTLYLQRALTKKLPEMSLAPLVVTVGKVVVATGVLSVVVWAGWAALRHGFPGNRVIDVLAVVVVIPVAIVTYGLAAFFLRVDGLVELVQVARKKLGLGAS